MNQKINYSIIIPHKNIPTLLERCLLSIPRREDIQIIVVDDNSDTDKVNFEKFPGLDDPFVEIFFTKEGKGAGYARNIGMMQAIGKWILFADADDFFNYCINEILDKYIDSDKDIIYFKHNSLDTNTYSTTCRNMHYNTYIDYWFYSPNKADYFLRYVNAVPWSKLFKNDFIKKHRISFDEVSINNDITFAYLTGFYARSICVDLRSLYCITVRQGSLQHGKKSVEKKIDAFFVKAKRYRFFRDYGISVFYRHISFVNLIIRFLFFDKNHFAKMKNILGELNFSLLEVIGLCLYFIAIVMPLIVISKLFHHNHFFLAFLLKLIKKCNSLGNSG